MKIEQPKRKYKAKVGAKASAERERNLVNSFSKENYSNKSKSSEKRNQQKLGFWF